MSIMKMYVEEYLAAEQVAEDRYIIHLSNGKEIERKRREAFEKEMEKA